MDIRLEQARAYRTALTEETFAGRNAMSIAISRSAIDHSLGAPLIFRE
jgi:hypothetical protein